MLSNLAKKVFGSAGDRFIRSLAPAVARINALEAEVSRLSDEALAAQTTKFRERLAAGETLDKLLPEAFATVREASKRVLGMRHFDVQLMGGMILHKGMISEMKTGEGKTLVCTLAAYLNALPAKGVHVVTVNDYLASRDAEWMGKLYRFLGLSVGCIVHGLEDDERRAQYACDITYATNNELGFDYLRDNMKYTRDTMVHRPFAYAIVDEVDSILIDEARTPLIISGPTEDNSELYYKVDALVATLAPEHFEKDEKHKNVTLTEAGVHHMEALMVAAGHMTEGTSLYDIGNVSLVHHVNQALRAHVTFARDVDYIVKDNKVIIIDEFTGRMMEGRRYSEGLHQALEAKEKVPVQNENQTLASITFQNYFRMYPKLAGMTGTAMTEAGEFRDIYKLETMEVPTNVPVSRIDYDDEVYRTAEEKYAAVIKLIKECNERKQPVLVGTISIEKSEYLSKLLKKEKIQHHVLNARYHEQEAFIISQAGQPAAVTIATNMAGRGTDIMLGGNAEMMIKAGAGENESRIREQVARDKETVLAAGGLFVIATERHESRRIDNQLRGRSGRQGDPGASKFFISLEDDLMRIFGATEMISKLMGKSFEEGEAIIHPLMTRTMERAQKKVEARNYEIRKHLLKFDDVMNDQRKVIFEQRIDLMESTDVSETVKNMRDQVVEDLVSTHIPAKAYAEQWDAEGLEKETFRIFGLHIPAREWVKEEGIADDEIRERLAKIVDEHMVQKEAKFGADLMRMAEKRVLLTTLDHIWKDHLLSLDHLRHGINLRAYGQRDPLNEYKQEAFGLFERMINYLRELVTERMAHIAISVEPAMEAMPTRRMQESRIDPAMAGEDNVVSMNSHNMFEGQKVGRNDACPCGSGKKFKHCHGQLN
jgi:preprotein translocase subunit SecA